jgi:hypothetical protein
MSLVGRLRSRVFERQECRNATRVNSSIRRFGPVRALLAAIPAVEKLVWVRARLRVNPGRVYPFLARKVG